MHEGLVWDEPFFLRSAGTSKPLGHPRDDSMRVQKRELEFLPRAVARVHERRARKQVFPDDLQPLPQTRARQQILFQDVDLTHRAPEKGRCRFDRLRAEGREPVCIDTAKRRVRKPERAPADGADSASTGELGEGITFVWLQRACEQRHVEQPQQRVAVVMVRDTMYAGDHQRMNRRGSPCVWTERRNGVGIANELRVTEDIGECSDVRDATVDVQRVKNAERVALLKMKLAGREATVSFGQSFVAEFKQRTRRGVASGRGNDQIRVGSGAQFGTRVVRPRQHDALQQHGPDIHSGERGEHPAKLALSRRLDGRRRQQIGLERSTSRPIGKQQVHPVVPRTRQKIVGPGTVITRVTKTTNQTISNFRHV